MDDAGNMLRGVTFFVAIAVLLVCMADEKIRDAYWGWRYRRLNREE